MNFETLAPHEMLELHEIIRNEVTCAKKTQASMGMVQDQDLKSFMERSIQSKKELINTYEQFYNKSVKQ